MVPFLLGLLPKERKIKSKFLYDIVVLDNKNTKLLRIEDFEQPILPNEK
jgi:hypothetical protein